MHAIMQRKWISSTATSEFGTLELQGTPGFDMGFRPRLEIRVVGTLMSCLELPPSQSSPIFCPQSRDVIYQYQSITPRCGGYHYRNTLGAIESLEGDTR